MTIFAKLLHLRMSTPNCACAKPSDIQHLADHGPIVWRQGHWLGYSSDATKLSDFVGDLHPWLILLVHVGS